MVESRGNTSRSASLPLYELVVLFNSSGAGRLIDTRVEGFLASFHDRLNEFGRWALERR
jgi:hypothetical protein